MHQFKIDLILHNFLLKIYFNSKKFTAFQACGSDMKCAFFSAITTMVFSGGIFQVITEKDRFYFILYNSLITEC